VTSVELDELGNGDDITTWHKRYTCREYGVGGVHIAFQLEVAALIFAVLTAITPVIRGIIFTTPELELEELGLPHWYSGSHRLPPDVG
jgi:hypothetical protein